MATSELGTVLTLARLFRALNVFQPECGETAEDRGLGENSQLRTPNSELRPEGSWEIAVSGCMGLQKNVVFNVSYICF